MDAQTKQPKSRGRKRRSSLSVAFFFVLAVCLVTGVVLWRCRIAAVTRVVRVALDKQGLSDLSFRLSHLSPSRVVVEEIRLGNPEPLLAVDRIDLRFSAPELVRRQVERVQVQGVRTTLIARDGKMFSPLMERLKPMLAASQAARGKARPSDAGQTDFSLWMGTMRDVRVEVLSSAGRTPLATLMLDAGTVSESPGRYRIWGFARDARSLFQLKVGGTLHADTGAVSVAPELKVKDVGAVLGLAQSLMPDPSAAFAAVPTNCSLTASGDFSFMNWTEAGPFEVSAEFSRGSEFSVPLKNVSVRFQTLRAEAAGTPGDVLCRVSAGVAAFRMGGSFEASQEQGRMLSLRGAARLRSTATNQWLTASLDSDLPGRSIAKVLPRVLPLVPVFFSDGGTLHTETEVSRSPQGAWQGQVRFAAEALRSAAPLTSGRAGAGTVRVTGTVAIADAKPGVMQTAFTLADVYFYRRNLMVRGDMEAALTSQPPYASAAGTFSGRLRESMALAQRNLSFKDGVVPFEGDAAVTGLTSNPAWRIVMRVPEFGVVATGQTSRVEGMAGAAATVRYGTSSVAVEGDVWMRDTAVLTGPVSNRVGEAGVSRIAARFSIPEFNRAMMSNAVVNVTFGVSNGWAAAGSGAVLEDVRCEVPFTWSLASGLTFLPHRSLTWRRLEAQGLKTVPDGFLLSTRDNAVEVRLGLRVSESKVGVTARALVPLLEPMRAVITVTLPDAEIMADGAVAAAVRSKVKDTEVTGHVAAEATLRFLGSQPHVLGRVKVTDGRVRSGKVEVEGLTLDVPFESGVFFRTIERPFVSFTKCKVGNVLLDQGCLDFQVTQQGLFADRLEVGWCKGSLNAYSVHLDFKNPKDDFIVYADRIDLGEALMMVVPFKGKMEGVLYGRFPVGFDKGQVKLSTGFLYSLPGQGGKLRLDDHRQMLSLLDKSGIKGTVQVPLSKALSDMDFNTFKMELEPKPDGDGTEGTLRLKMVGRSNDKDWPAPVDLNLNLHGPLEELLNIGIGVSRK